ncbi:amidohydrolase family protein [Nonomuraea sp. NN258]|uniref:amidohydrolase family protein n=1 Tax=Nonomuraea antri TaxID=2730852 RepID=UPI0015685102|nr:amidohydrolase family protein [Nonomuraea antri]NRQ36529.1 amidohydrolase family protein [Nonomuraea antri]
MSRPDPSHSPDHGAEIGLARPAEPATITLIKDVRVFDGERTIPRADVVIRDDVIEAVSRSPLRTDAWTHRVDGAGLTLLPGLIDSHTHALPGGLAQALRFGVTTELDMFSVPGLFADVRRQARDRDDVADVRTSSVGANAPGGHPHQLMGEVFGPLPGVRDADDAKAFVAARVEDGADYLKIIIEDGAGMGSRLPTLEPATVEALVRAAHEAGLQAIAHATTLDATEIALNAGVDGLAHLCFEPCPDPEEFAAKLAQHGVFVTATLALLEAFTVQGGTELAADERIGPHLDGSTRAALGRALPGAPLLPGRVFDSALAVTGALHRAGVPILAGTDANDGPHGPFPVVHGASLHRELCLLVQAGLSAAEALAAATSVPARQFGLTDRGRIAPGLRADLLLVAGDPTVRITDTRSISAIWRRGARR